MSMNKDNVKGFSQIVAIACMAVVILVLSGVLALSLGTKSPAQNQSNIGAGTLPIENYVPAIQQNGGYYSAKPITTTNTVTGEQLTSTDDATIADQLSVGGVSEDWITGSFTDATTTPVAVLNPFGQNVIVDSFEAYISNGTSTIAFTCGTSTSPYLSADPTDLLVDDLSMASSTAGTATTTAYVKNGDDYAGTSLANAGTNSEDAILWKTGEYITCYADTLYPGALTETTNIFSGYYRIRSRYDANF